MCPETRTRGGGYSQKNQKVNLAYPNFFEAKFPKVSPEKYDIWFTHPKIPARVNEFGVVESTDPALEFYVPHNPFYVGSKFIKGELKGLYKKGPLMFCAYHNISHSSRYLFYADGNPYNFQKENLVVPGYSDPDLLAPAMENTHQFLINTMEIMAAKIQRWSHFFDQPDFFANFKIPDHYIQFYEKPETLAEMIELDKKRIKKFPRKTKTDLDI